MSVLRFFFALRFSRADVLVIVVAAVSRAAGELSFLGMLALLFGGFLLTGIGEKALEKREQSS